MVIACILVGFIVLHLLGALLYFTCGFFKFFYHDILEWHIPDGKGETFDGVNRYTHCKYCGEEIIQDSQGNWFTPCK